MRRENEMFDRFAARIAGRTAFTIYGIMANRPKTSALFIQEYLVKCFGIEALSGWEDQYKFTERRNRGTIQ